MLLYWKCKTYVNGETHVDESRTVLELRLQNCVYINPVFPGDTLTKSFVIQDIRETADGKNVLVEIGKTNTYIWMVINKLRLYSICKRNTRIQPLEDNDVHENAIAISARVLTLFDLCNE